MSICCEDLSFSWIGPPKGVEAPFNYENTSNRVTQVTTEITSLLTLSRWMVYFHLRNENDCHYHNSGD